MSSASLVASARRVLRRHGWAQLTLHLVAVTYLATHVFLAGWIIVPAVVRGLDPVVIEGGSMEPTLSVGDVVLVDTEVAAPAIGAVVTFEDGAGRVVTHRHVGDDGDDLVTQGDANPERDAGTVTPERLIGVGRLAVPFAGLPATWLRRSPLLLGLWLAGTTAAVAVASRTRRALDRPDARSAAAGRSAPDDRGGDIDEVAPTPDVDPPVEGDWSWPTAVAP